MCKFAVVQVAFVSKLVITSHDLVLYTTHVVYGQVVKGLSGPVVSSVVKSGRHKD